LHHVRYLFIHVNFMLAPCVSSAGLG
jgi:hypothetical protein